MFNCLCVLVYMGRISVTYKPIWFSFTVNLFIGPGKIKRVIFTTIHPLKKMTYIIC